MPDQDLCHSLQQCQKKMVRWPGTWRLEKQRAISLKPRQPSQILITKGQAWITWELTNGWAQAGVAAVHADRVLEAGEILDVPAGVHLVMESLQPQQVLDFDWRSLPADAALVSSRRHASLLALLWQWLRAWQVLGIASVQLLRALLGHWRLRVKPWPVAPLV